MKSKEAGITILVALIGLCGVLGAAAINNWDKFFPPTPTFAPPTQPPPTRPPTEPSTSNPGSDTGPNNPVCAGTEVGGSCWYFGEDSLSCESVCSSHGGYSEATRIYAGSDGTASNCQNVLASMNIPLDNFYETQQGGIGCFTIQTASGNYFGYWDTAPTTASATYVTPGRQRLCACKQ
jgi:hypothetical protein